VEFKNMRCDAQKIKMIQDFTTSSKTYEARAASTMNPDMFYKILRLKSKQLVKREMQRIIDAPFFNTKAKRKAIDSEELEIYNNAIRLIKEENSTGGNRIMNQYQLDLERNLNKAYSFDQDRIDCEMGFFITLITDRFGKCVAFENGKKRINLKNKDDRQIGFKKLFLKGICDDDQIGKKMAQLREVFALIDDSPLYGHLWYLYLIGYILNVKLYIMDFSCVAHFDTSKRQSRQTSRSNSDRRVLSDAETCDPNIFSVADLRNIVVVRRGGGRGRPRRSSVTSFRNNSKKNISRKLKHKKPS